jgi:hypothetical protein
MSRHPYTHACDFIRSIPDRCEDGISTKLSRSEASQIRQKIAAVIGMDDAELAEKLSIAYQQENEL